MARYGVQTKLEPEQVIERAMSFFGEEGMNMELLDRHACCVRFGGSAGFIEVTAAEEQNGASVELLTDEWDYDVRRFMNQIAR